MDFEKDIHKKMQHITMSDDERDKMDDAVLSFMDANPIKAPAAIRNAAPKESMKERIAKTQQSFASLFVRRLSYAALMLVIAVSAGGGTVLASQKALPGDALYGLKVNVAEEIQSRLSPTEKARAEWEAERVRRRLLEIKTLLEQDGTVADTTLEEVKGHITDHTGAVALATNKLGAAGDSDAILDIVLQLQDTLDTYKTLLGAVVAEEGTGVSPDVLTLLDNVEQTEQAAQAVQLGSFLEHVDAQEPTEEDETVIETTNLVQLTSPKAGDVLVQGELLPIAWDIDVEGATFMTIELIDEAEAFVGYVGANGLNVSSRRWNPEYIFDISGTPVPSSVAPGQYRMLYTVETRDDRVYEFRTGLFSIVAPHRREVPVVPPVVPESEALVDREIDDRADIMHDIDDMIDDPVPAPVTSDTKDPGISLKQYIERDGNIRPGSNGIIASWLTHATGPAQIARLKIRCTKPASVETTFKYMDLEDAHGNKLAGSTGVFAAGPTQQVAVFNDIAVPIRLYKQTDFRVRGYVISGVEAHSVSCGILSRDDVLFRDLADQSVFTSNINEGLNTETYIGENIAITPDADEFLSFIKPQMFEEVDAGSIYILRWDVLDASTNEYAATFTLVNAAGTEVGKIGTVFDLSEQELEWVVPSDTLPGTYVIQAKTVEHSMILKSDAFYISE